MRDADDKLFIMEVNPRFPAWIYLSAAAGQNQPAALVKMALGEQVESFESYETGKMFVRYAWDHIVDVSEFQQISAPWRTLIIYANDAKVKIRTALYKKDECGYHQ